MHKDIKYLDVYASVDSVSSHHGVKLLLLLSLYITYVSLQKIKIEVKNKGSIYELV